MARRTSSNKTMVAIEMFGMDEFLRELRFAPAETKKAIKQGNKVIADKVVVEMKKRAKVVFHAQQYETIVPSLRAVQGTVPKVKLGGARKAAVSRRKDRPAAGELVMGVEFGAKRRGRRTRQFPMAKRGGFVLFPTIHKLHDFIKKEYTANIEKVLRKVAR
jgi:hypothetical protein